MDIPSLISIIQTPSSNKGRCYLFMGEAIISRGGGTHSGGSSEENSNFRTEIITSTTLWKVPENLKDGTVSVRIFGGGGGGRVSFPGGGSGGYMNNAILNLSNESEIYIQIGRGGDSNGVLENRYASGGTTSFGSYLSALGGGSEYGGSGGGGYGNGDSSNGYQFGGGGACCSNYKSSEYGGTGGKWGGGGGTGHGNYMDANRFTANGGCLYENSQNIIEVTGYSGLGGNGGWINTMNLKSFSNATNGVNTIGMGLEFEGAGLCGNYAGGGGGYGGNGGNNYGGGGGYGSNGGDGYIIINNTYDYRMQMAYGGGGGGYGGDGGNGGSGVAGGGGGYGKHGRGGGKLSNGIIKMDGGIAAGGAYAGGKRGRGGDGICIIQYYVK